MLPAGTLIVFSFKMDELKLCAAQLAVLVC